MILESWAANQIFRFVSNQLCHPGKRRIKMKKLSRFLWKICHQGGQRSGSVWNVSYRPSQWVKWRSMLWRVRKVLASRGNSTLDGWGTGSHNSIITRAAGGDVELSGRMWPVQWNTWGRTGVCSEARRHPNNFRHEFVSVCVPTFHAAHFKLTERPLLVSVLFNRRKKFLSLNWAPACFLAEAGNRTKIRRDETDIWLRGECVYVWCRWQQTWARWEQVSELVLVTGMNIVVHTLTQQFELRGHDLLQRVILQLRSKAF